MNAEIQNDHVQTVSEITDIAIVGMSCRYPGDVTSPQEFWEFLLRGGDGIVDIPADRWDSHAYYDADKEKPSRMYVKRGGFIRDIDLFDPQFFNISPKEAPHIDPQHRWLLELTQEAFENAGLSASALKGSDTAVYIGQFMHDYEQIQLDSMARNMMSSHSATGPSMTLTANRISYAFDFIGPSVTLDTACSSSLVALDMACKAIINGDSKLAIAGGVNILLRPELTMSICKASMLSPDGRCKSFDASANGYVRSEGAGLVVLKSLAQAKRDGDNILAVIKATGVNQDGQTIGITVPNGESQQKLLRKTLGRAKIATADIQYAEAHGTGTAVGDPIEVNALGGILGNRDSGKARCVIGSVKSNIGHSEAAAGVAGLIKTVLAINEGVIPQNIHYHNTNPGINLKELNVEIAAKQLSWPDTEGKPRRAIVNSFGFGGTNANVVLEQGPNRETRGSDQKPVINSDLKLLPISSKTEIGLRAQAEKYAAYLKAVAASAENNPSLHNICYTAATKRDHYKYRLIVNGADVDEMLLGLNEYVVGNPSTGYMKDAVNVETGKGVCFVFSGMGTTWAGMGKDLYHTEPVFKAMMDRCDQALHKLAGWSLLDALFNESDPEKIHATYIAQPAIFATQVSLAELLKSWGVTPDCIVGHSAGEVGAAYAAGIYSFDDAIKIIYHRSRLQHTTDGMGKMLAVALTEEALHPYLAGRESAISIAAVNSEDALTLSGDEQVLTDIAAQLDDQGIFARFLNVGVPYHSPAMDQLKQSLIDELSGIQVKAPHTPLYSTVSGQLTQPGDWTAEYWPKNVREPVRFKAAIDNIIKEGIKAFVEIAPHTALSSSIKKNLAQHSDAGAVIGTLKRDQNGVVMVTQTLASLHAAGLPLDWQKLYPNGGTFVTLPNYAWQHAGYWHESEEVKQCRLKNISKRGGFSEVEHPLVGGRLHSITPFWQNQLDVQQQSYLQDHQVEGEIVYPGAAYVEMALFIARHATQQECITLENVDFKRAFFLDKGKPTIIETTYDAVASRFKISAVETQTEQWEVFSEGVVSSVAKVQSTVKIVLSEIKALLPDTMAKAEFYSHCHQLGLGYQRDFQTVENAWYSDMDALVEIQLPASLANSSDDYLLHPSILDGAFQSLFPTINSGYLPVKITELHYFRKPGSKLYCHLITKFKDDLEIKGDLTLFDEDGNVLVEIIGVELKSTKTQLATSEDDSTLYDYRWLKEPLPESNKKSESADENLWIVFADAGGVGTRLAQHLEGRGESVCVITQTAAFDQVDERRFGLNVQSCDDLVPVLNPFSHNCRGLIYLWGLDNPACESLSADELLNSCHATTVIPLHVVQALDKVEWRHTQKIFFASRAAHIVDQETFLPQPSQAALWGFGRVFASEYPDHSVSLVDLPETIGDALVSQFANEVLNDDYEQEIALRDATRYVNRLRKLHQSELQEYASAEVQLEADAVFQISRSDQHSISMKTVLQSLVLPTLAPDEVAIKVAYAGINHYDLDVILAQNSGAERAEAAPGQGFECVGTIVSIGAAMTALSVGDKVMGFARQGLSSIVHAQAQNLTKIPAHLSLEQAAAIPAAFLTAHYSLNQLAALREGETVLIHEAADSVGLAAVQLAKAKSATIYVTAATQEKREYLRSLGLAHVYDSTTFEFVHGIGGPARDAGIDIVLNSLTGQFIEKTVGLMNSFGRFVEIGQRTTRNSSNLIDALGKKNISYHSVNTTALVSQRPQVCAALLQELVDLLESGALAPLPVKVFAADKAMDGIAYAASNTEANQVVVNFDIANVRASQGINPQIINSHSSYLVTGGLGGLGLEIMHWLADKGAKSIVLIGRSTPSESAQAAMDIVRSKGIAVSVLQADITKLDDVRHVLATIEKTLLPLAGIIHSAGVLEDGTIAQQTAEKFQKVLAPKVKGAWNLHQLTAHIELDFFVCFSSIASIVGWAGQSNYAAANAFMDGLAFHRRALGKPALTINWGPWGGAGMAANLDDRELQRMTDAGMTPLDSANGLAAMTQLLEYRVPQSGVFDLNWSLIFKQYPDPSRKTVFKDLVKNLETTNSVNFFDELMSVSADKHESLLLKQIAQVMAEVLGIEDSAGIDKHVSVFEYGLNSLMSMDFRNKLQAILQLKLPSTLVLKYPTIDAMTKYIVENLLVDSSKTYDEVSTVNKNQTVKVSI